MKRLMTGVVLLAAGAASAEVSYDAGADLRVR